MSNLCDEHYKSLEVGPKCWKCRIAELEDDNRRLSEIEQRRISEAITQANSIAELREQLAELKANNADAMNALMDQCRSQLAKELLQEKGD